MAEVYKLKYLRGKRLKIFLAIADRIIPPDADSAGGGTLVTAGIADWALERMAPGLRGLLLTLLLGVEIMGVFFGGLPFTMNSDAAKDRQLRWMERGPIGRLRMGFFGLKTYICMGYYTREDVWKTIHYEGPLVDRPFPDPVIRALCQGGREVSE